MPKKRLVICAVFADCAARLPEWLAYHHLVGFEHFVLYDNGSTDDPAQAVRSTPMAEHVTLIRWPQRPGKVTAYRHFIDIFAPGFEWVAFLDVDEFLLPLDSRNVIETLDALPDAAAILVHRRMFSPAAATEPPSGLLIEAFDRRAADDFPANRQVRTIARCGELLDVTQNPYEFRLNGPVFTTGGHEAPAAAVQQATGRQRLVVNHYCTGSHKAWLAALGDAAPSDLMAALSQISDTAIQAHAPEVRRLLGLSSPASVTAEAVDAVATVAPDLPSAVAATAPPQVPEPVATEAATPSPVAPEPPPAAPSVAAMAPSPVPPEPVGTETAAPAAPAPTAVDPAPAAAASPELPPGWVQRGPDALERIGFALVFRDRSRVGEHWLAALRGSTASTTDPAFLTDDFDRIRDFPSAGEAQAACDAALTRSRLAT